MHQVWRLICLGWKTITQASTVAWLLSLLPSTVISIVLASLAWVENQPAATIGVILVVVFGIIFLCTLAYLGYRYPYRHSEVDGDVESATVMVPQPILGGNATEVEIRLTAVRDLYDIVNGPVREALEYGSGIIESMQGIVRDHCMSGFLNCLDIFRNQLNAASATLAQARRKYELYSEVYSDWDYIHWPEFWESFNGFLRVLRTIDSGPRLDWETVNTLTEPTKYSFQIELKRVNAWIGEAKRALQSKRQKYK